MKHPHTYCCLNCESLFTESQAHTVTIPDDRDQMYDRPMGGTREVLACPECGRTDIEEAE